MGRFQGRASVMHVCVHCMCICAESVCVCMHVCTYGPAASTHCFVHSQEITKLKNEITRHKRTIQRLEEEQGISSAKSRPLVSRN